MRSQAKGGGDREGKGEPRRWTKTENKGEGSLNKQKKTGVASEAFDRLATISLFCRGSGVFLNAHIFQHEVGWLGRGTFVLQWGN